MQIAKRDQPAVMSMAYHLVIEDLRRERSRIDVEIKRIERLRDAQTPAMRAAAIASKL